MDLIWAGARHLSRRAMVFELEFANAGNRPSAPTPRDLLVSIVCACSLLYFFIAGAADASLCLARNVQLLKSEY
jgi:hypothetical protein